MKKIICSLVIVLSLNIFGNINNFINAINTIGMGTYGLQTSDKDTVIKLLEQIRDDGPENVPIYTNNSIPNNVLSGFLDGWENYGFSNEFISNLNANIIDALGDDSSLAADLYIQPILYNENLIKMFDDTRKNAVNRLLTETYKQMSESMELSLVDAQKVLKSIEMGITYNELVGYVYVIAIVLDVNAMFEGMDWSEFEEEMENIDWSEFEKELENVDWSEFEKELENIDWSKFDE